MASLVLFLITMSAAVLSKATKDFRFISHEDLLPTSDRFSVENVTSYSQLLFDVASDQVIVGARDTLFRLTLSLGLQETAAWPAPPTTLEMCLTKGQSERDCHNHIKVLLPSPNGNSILACGTNAFSPSCSWRETNRINKVVDWVKGVAKCPYNPNANITALMTSEGSLFVGSPTDFSGSDPAIYRSMGEGHNLRTNQYNSKWLNEPQFVGSFEADGFVYFMFRESAVEYINCGKIIYSRIARVCKNDMGGQLMLKDNWTTFVKARLNCSLPGEYPFYFDEIQGMAYAPDEDEGVVYATFSTPGNSISGSAICSFNMSSINAAFAGPFKHQETTGSAWERHHSPHASHFECKATPSPRQHTLLDSSRYQLMDTAVQPRTSKPLHVAELERYTYIALDSLATKLHTAQRIIYAATASGLVKKISYIARTSETCVVEIWRPELDTAAPIKTLQFLKKTNSLYIGTEHSVMRIPAHHCSRHVSQASCLDAMDPYCGWNDLKRACTPAPNDDPLVSHWQQAVTSCPVLNAPVDGGWSTWSDWFSCQQHQSTGGHHGAVDSPGDSCLCRSRRCDNPAPQNGGSVCTGMDVGVTNCTVHGEWTNWSAWSACSQTCGMAVKTRRRSCGNPAPAHGGRVCVGADRNEIYCTTLPPCPMHKPPPRDGGWGAWQAWGSCSAECDGGYQTRERVCDNPAPLHGGAECYGTPIEFQVCNNHTCPESRKLSSWTPWVVTQNGTYEDGSYTERRFRFVCRAPVLDLASVKVTLTRDEQRTCTSDRKCSRSSEPSDEVWSEWSSWSSCSADCGGGEQTRTRTCEAPRQEHCEGASKMTRVCNMEACQSSWGCWTDWSSCTGSCGMGRRQRSRSCLTTGNGLPVHCQGSPVQQEPCDVSGCDSRQGWDEWTVWSLCDDDDEQHRRRKCLTSNPGPDMCQGHDRESRLCVYSSNEVTYGARVGASSGDVGVVLASCIATFILGAVCTYIAVFVYKRRTRVRIPSSPHYITAKQNSYVTVPLKEITPKRQHSFTGASSSHGTLSKTNNVANGNTISPPKLYPKSLCTDYDVTTLKRNSHAMNNGNVRPDSEQDKFY